MIEFNDLNLKRRKRKDKVFSVVFLSIIIILLLLLLWLIVGILIDGIPKLNLDFILNYPSRFVDKAGIFPGLVSSLYLIILVAIFSVIVGVGSALYLEEYASKSYRVVRIIDVSITNLSGVPAIIYGILGVSIFSYFTYFKASLLAGAVTLSLLVLPVIIVSSQEALKSVPSSLKQAAYGLGMSKWQVIKCVVLPYATPGILTGIILSLSRAIGEGAPLIVVGAATIMTSIPTQLSDPFTALPILIFYWAGQPKEEFQSVAAAASIVLIAVLILLNSIAILIRNKYQIDY